MGILSKVTKDNSTIKSYKFSKEKISLNFTLRVDTKSELKDFLELLKVATLEVEEDLNKK